MAGRGVESVTGHLGAAGRRGGLKRWGKEEVLVLFFFPCTILYRKLILGRQICSRSQGHFVTEKPHS